MQFLEALKILETVKPSPSRKVAFLSSFEPLHFKMFLQAHLAQRFPIDSPEVLTFGYDHLDAALTETETIYKSSPTLLFLSWEDLHPALSWRTRGSFSDIATEDLDARAGALRKRLITWAAQRTGSETYLVTAPNEWMPYVSSFPSDALSPLTLAADKWMSDIRHSLSMHNLRTLRFSDSGLQYRDLLDAGCPLTLESGASLAQQFIELAFPSIERKKMIVVDLDQTLWHGVLGEDGAKAIQAGPEGKGHAFHVFQKFLLRLKKEGILLAFCTKNNPSDVLPVFDTLEMPLRLKDFALYRCNWDAKPDNICALAKEATIGLGSLLVIDDNAAEIAHIQSVLPEVTVLQTPREGHAWLALFKKVQDLCASWELTDEDRARTASIQSNLNRSAFEKQASANGGPKTNSVDYLHDLKHELAINRVAFSDPRSLQIINKVNQFNLTGERLTPEMWQAWEKAPNTFCWSVKLKDRFGDFGTIAVVTGKKNGKTLEIKHLILSCRAFGRGVEALLLGALVRSLGADAVTGFYKDTGKNEPIRRFLTELGATMTAEGKWTLPKNVVLTASDTILKRTQAVMTGVAV